MDHEKAEALKAELADASEPILIPAERFFDGNDDEDSIGCNLMPHPGIETFRRIITGLARQPGVEGVFMRISELDPGEGCWPFSDHVIVLGEPDEETLAELLKPLEPFELGHDINPNILAALRLPDVTGLEIFWD